MNERIYQSSMDDVVSKRALPPKMLKDLHNLASLDEGTCQRLAEALKSVNGVSPSDAVEEVVLDCLGKGREAEAKSVLDALNNLEPSGIDLIVETLQAWVSANESRQKLFTKSLVEQLQRNLTILIADYPAVELKKKADKLLRDVGNELRDVKFICDFRPVFNESRTDIEALVLIANLRLLYVSQDSNPHVCEMALTEDELIELRDRAELALNKMKVMKEYPFSSNVNSEVESDKS